MGKAIAGVRRAARRPSPRLRPVIPSLAVGRSTVATLVPIPLVVLLAGSSGACADGRSASAELSAGIGEGGDEGAKMRVVRNEKAVEVEAGEGIDLVVTRPVGIPQELRFTWPPAPSVEGDSVRFVRLRIEEPSPEDDGGVTTFHYELEAVRPGAARVTLAPKPAGRESAQPPVVLDVTVRGAAPR